MNGVVGTADISQTASPASTSSTSPPVRQQGPNGHGDFSKYTPSIDRSPVFKPFRFPGPGYGEGQWDGYPQAAALQPAAPFYGGRGRGGRGRGRGGSFRGRGMNQMNGMGPHGMRSPPPPHYVTPQSPPNGLAPLGYPFDPATAAYYLPYGPPAPAGPAQQLPSMMPPPFVPVSQFDRPRPQLNYDPPLDPVRFWALGQTEFYMSSDNLARDPFLRSQVRFFLSFFEQRL
jgi:la-related protein 1